MKLLRWSLAGASAYVIYKYTIGKKSRGKELSLAPEENAKGEQKQLRKSAARFKRTRP